MLFYFEIKHICECVSRNVFTLIGSTYFYILAIKKFHIFINCDEPDFRFITKFIRKSIWLFCILSKDQEFVTIPCISGKQCCFYYQIVSFGGCNVSTRTYEMNLQNTIANHMNLQLQNITANHIGPNKCTALLAEDKPLSMQEDEQHQPLYCCQLQLMAWKHEPTSFQ